MNRKYSKKISDWHLNAGISIEAIAIHLETPVEIIRKHVKAGASTPLSKCKLSNSYIKIGRQNEI